jgi:transposase
VKVCEGAIITIMPAPLFVRALTQEERATLQAGRWATEAFTLRRSQILLASAEGHTPRQIAQHWGCGDQTVRKVLRAVAREGVGCLQQQASRPKRTKPHLEAAKADKLRELRHPAPREFGKARSTWTLVLVAEVCAERRLTPHQVSDETVGMARRRLGLNWKRAKHWLTSPDPAYKRKKRLAIG